MGKGFGGDKKLKKKKRIRSEEEQMLIMKWKALTRRSLSDASPLKMKQSSYYYYSKFLSNAFGETELESSRNDIDIPTSGISRPLSEILKQLHKKVPDSLVRQRLEDGCSVKYIPWHIVNRIMNLHAPEWSGEVRNITYSPDGKSVSVVYRVTLYGTDAEGIEWDCFSGSFRLWRCCTKGRSNGISSSLCTLRSWASSLS
ncbi:uncharacterized protein LOC8269990 isoform X2 [Ricinus communis]|uniref:uncharacterized protein LOC8269990 isoform X2 n=1 Tax=Ricinus communis TaxID=3988 RepID=UPI00201AEF88|nr:uncharacterized protein LOC8269990 isoform X2 [Ricinus communis]